MRKHRAHYYRTCINRYSANYTCVVNLALCALHWIEQTMLFSWSQWRFNFCITPFNGARCSKIIKIKCSFFRNHEGPQQISTAKSDQIPGNNLIFTCEILRPSQVREDRAAEHDPSSSPSVSETCLC